MTCFKHWFTVPQSSVRELDTGDPKSPHCLCYPFRTQREAARIGAAMEDMNPDKAAKILASDIVDNTPATQLDIAVAASTLAIQLQSQLNEAMRILQVSCGGDEKLWAEIKKVVGVRG